MSGLERAAYVSLLGFAAAPQFSIAASGILLGLSALLWLAVVIVNRERIEVPRMFWPLAAYAGATLVASLFSVDPSDQLRRTASSSLLFAIVPITYRLFRGERSLTVVDVVITVGALNAVYGIVQYGILDFDNVAQPRPGQPRALHDLLRGHHAGGVHRSRARDVPPPRADLGGARPARRCSSRSS